MTVPTTATAGPTRPGRSPAYPAATRQDHRHKCRYSDAARSHQQYLAKNPNGYCGLGRTGMSCPVGVAQVPEADTGRRRPVARGATLDAMPTLCTDDDRELARGS
jgi:hypothetical protein